MAEYYVDHGLYPTPVTGGTVPTSAEDGNGKGTGAASMATLVITFTGQPTAEQTITIAGVTFTAKSSGASGNQFNIGASASATAINLTTAINASTTNATQPSNRINATAPLRNVVNATVSGSVITIYTRCAGSEWNSVTENSTLSNVTITQWSGGTDGAWGYVINTSAIFPTSRAIGAYGVLTSQTPYLWGVVGGDVINCRAGNKILNFTATTSVTISNMGTINSPVIFNIDNSTIWSDGVKPKFTVKLTASSALTWSLTPSTNTFCVINGVTYDAVNDDRNLNFELDCSTGAAAIDLNFSPGSIIYSNVNLRSTNVSTTATVRLNCPNSMLAKNKSEFNFGLIENYRQSSTSFVRFTSNTTFSFSCKGTRFKLNSATDVHNGVIGLPGSAFGNMDFIACDFVGFIAGSKLHQAVSAISTSSTARFYDCTFNNVTDLGPSFLGVASTALDASALQQGVIGSTKYNKRDFFVNTTIGYYEWNSSLNFPTLNARLLDNTPWSLRIIPATISENISATAPLRLPVISKINSLASAVRTISVEFGLEKSLSWTKKDIFFIIEYIDSNNIMRVESSQDWLDSALTGSTATWSTNVDDGGVTRFTWASPALIYFNRYKLSLTTQYQVKNGEEISVTVCVGRTVPDTTKMLFIDPEILVV